MGQTLDVYHGLAKYAEVKGIVGNVDDPEIAALFPEKLLIEVKDYRIGVVHGHVKRWTTERRAIEAFKEEEVDCIIFGHSHIPIIKEVDGILLFNPGSATDKRKQPYYSYGIITINHDIVAEHVFYEDKL